MKRRRPDEETGNYDAFLDIVANMVGILIILVVVLGSRSKEVAKAVHEEAARAAVAARAEVPQESATKINNDMQRLRQQLAAYDQELLQRKRERDGMLALLTVAQQQWQEKQQQLAAEAQQAAQLAAVRRQLIDSVKVLELEASQSVPKTKDEVIAVEHLPTPMAQTVFGEEIHFRLKAGRLSVVPLDALVHEIEEDFRRTISGVPREGVKQGTVGPIRDYIARYSVRTSRGRVSQGGSFSTAIRVELAGLVIEPMAEPVGEPIADALRDNSQMAYEVSGRDPRSTTITVWVYPDSFAEFRLLKEHLYGLGFATAARPLPEGRPISGSPQGSRSTAQ